MGSHSNEKLARFATEFHLSPGRHASPAEGMCAIEVVAFLDGGPHTDSPRCACEIIAAFVRHLNDHMPDDIRPKLLPYLPRLIDSVSREREQARHEYLAWQAVRVFAPAALRVQGYGRFARLLDNVETLYRAHLATKVILEAIARREGSEELSPVWLSVHRSLRAASAAMWFEAHQNDFAKGANAMTDYTACAEAAAGAAFQAHRAGVADSWDKALEALEGVLSVGTPEREKAEVASGCLTWKEIREW